MCDHTTICCKSTRYWHPLDDTKPKPKGKLLQKWCKIERLFCNTGWQINSDSRILILVAVVMLCCDFVIGLVHVDLFDHDLQGLGLSATEEDVVLVSAGG